LSLRPLQVAKEFGQDAFNLELMVQRSAKINSSASTYFILKKMLLSGPGEIPPCLESSAR
jgi:hypothetical protein